MIRPLSPVESLAPVAAPIAQAASVNPDVNSLAAPTPPPSFAESVMEAISRLTPEIRSQQSRLSISLDQEAERFVYRSVDRKTGEVVGQWPAEEVLRVISYLRQLEGLVVDERV